MSPDAGHNGLPRGFRNLPRQRLPQSPQTGTGHSSVTVRLRQSEVLQLDFRTLAERQPAQQTIPQLANVARPVILSQRMQHA